MDGSVSDLEGILILGVPRSGTTLLRRLLNAHPNIACPSETNVFAACGRFLRSEVIAEGVHVGVLDGLAYAGFPQDEVLRRLRDLAFGFHREYAQRHGKKRWAAKTAFDIFYLEEIELLCADKVAYVCIQRHGLDVVTSLHELCEKNGTYLRELHDYVIRYPNFLEAFARVWVDLSERLMNFLARHPSNAFLVRYEDLVRDPQATMRAVFGFLGEEWREAWVSYALSDRSEAGLGDWKTYAKSEIDTSSVGRWKSLSRYTIRGLASICNETLRRCGYEEVDASVEERPPEEAQRRYQIGLLLQALSSRSRGSDLAEDPQKKGP